MKAVVNARVRLAVGVVGHGADYTLNGQGIMETIMTRSRSPRRARHRLASTLRITTALMLATWGTLD